MVPSSIEGSIMLLLRSGSLPNNSSAKASFSVIVSIDFMMDFMAVSTSLDRFITILKSFMGGGSSSPIDMPGSERSEKGEPFFWAGGVEKTSGSPPFRSKSVSGVMSSPARNRSWLAIMPAAAVFFLSSAAFFRSPSRSSLFRLEVLEVWVESVDWSFLCVPCTLILPTSLV